MCLKLFLILFSDCVSVIFVLICFFRVLFFFHSLNYMSCVFFFFFFSLFFFFFFLFVFFFFFFKQKTAYEIVDCDWSSDVCSSDLAI